MSSMRTQRMRAARRSTAAALRRRRIKRMIGRHKCRKCFTKATWRRSRDESSKKIAPRCTTGNTTTIATHDVHAWHRRNRAQFQQECLMSTKILMTKMLIWESRGNYKKRCRNFSQQRIGLTRKDGMLHLRRRLYPRAQAKP